MVQRRWVLRSVWRGEGKGGSQKVGSLLEGCKIKRINKSLKRRINNFYDIKMKYIKRHLKRQALGCHFFPNEVFLIYSVILLKCKKVNIF